MKKLRLTSVAAAAALAITSLVAYAPVSNAKARTVTIAFQGPLTGEEAQIGQDELAGVQYAVRLFNAKNKGKINVKIVRVDDQGDPAQAAKVAPGVAANSKIIGLVGPAYSGATIASLPFYKKRNLPMISPSATRVSITDPATEGLVGFPVFHRVVAPDNFQGPALYKLAIKDVTNPKVFVIDDQSSYGTGLRDYIKPALPKAQEAGFDSVAPTTDYKATIGRVKASGANVVIYTGYFSAAAVLFKQLRDDGYKGVLAGGDGVLSTDFPGLAPKGVLDGVRITAGTVPLGEISASLEADFKAKMGKSSGTYAAESIDAANVFLSCIEKGVSTRAAMLKCVKAYKGKSVSGAEIAFNKYGDVSSGGIQAFSVADGKIRYDGAVK